MIQSKKAIRAWIQYDYFDILVGASLLPPAMMLQDTFVN